MSRSAEKIKKSQKILDEIARSFGMNFANGGIIRPGKFRMVMIKERGSEILSMNDRIDSYEWTRIGVSNRWVLDLKYIDGSEHSMITDSTMRVHIEPVDNRSLKEWAESRRWK